MAIKELCTGIQHLGLPTKDIDATIEFYKSLGFEIDWRTPAGSPDNVAFLRLSNLVIETYVVPQTAGQAGAIDHVAIDVTDIDAAFAFCQAGGYKMLDEHVNTLPFYDKGVKFFTILGVNNEKVEFNQKL